MDPNDLYKQTLLKHSRQPKNEQALPRATHQAKVINTLCGDEVTVYLELKDDIISSASFVGQCCSICKASASMLTEKLPLLTLPEAKQFSQQLIDELKDKDQSLTLKEDDDLRSLEGVKQFTSRIRCATLPWEAFLKSQSTDS